MLQVLCLRTSRSAFIMKTNETEGLQYGARHKFQPDFIHDRGRLDEN